MKAGCVNRLPNERLIEMLFVLTTPLHHLFLFSMLFVQQAESTDFDDLGKMLFAGFALAIAVAVLFVFVKLRLREKNPHKAEFLSIGNVPEEK